MQSGAAHASLTPGAPLARTQGGSAPFLRPLRAPAAPPTSGLRLRPPRLAATLRAGPAHPTSASRASLTRPTSSPTPTPRPRPTSAPTLAFRVARARPTSAALTLTSALRAGLARPTSAATPTLPAARRTPTHAPALSLRATATLATSDAPAYPATPAARATPRLSSARRTLPRAPMPTPRAARADPTTAPRAATSASDPVPSAADRVSLPPVPHRGTRLLWRVRTRGLRTRSRMAATDLGKPVSARVQVRRLVGPQARAWATGPCRAAPGGRARRSPLPCRRHRDQEAGRAMHGAAGGRRQLGGRA